MPHISAKSKLKLLHFTRKLHTQHRWHAYANGGVILCFGSVVPRLSFRDNRPSAIRLDEKIPWKRPINKKKIAAERSPFIARTDEA